MVTFLQPSVTSVRVHVCVRLIIPSTCYPAPHRSHPTKTFPQSTSPPLSVYSFDHPLRSSCRNPYPCQRSANAPARDVPRVPLPLAPTIKRERRGNTERESTIDSPGRKWDGEYGKVGWKQGRGERRHDPRVQLLPFLLPFRTFCCSCCRDLSTNCFPDQTRRSRSRATSTTLRSIGFSPLCFSVAMFRSRHHFLAILVSTFRIVL